MPKQTAISVVGLEKAYRIWASPAQRLLSPLYGQLAPWLPRAIQTRLAKKARAGYHDFFALQDVSFEVLRGEAVGIIGRNGAGKSTLLQIIAGTLRPSAGEAKIAGRVAALLELGAGFNPEFTGRENVFLNGAILGISKSEMEARFPAIAGFAEIGDFIDQPVKTYSSGMLVRLAFAVQTAVEPDILIVDEALSVGDIFFQQKCAARMRVLREAGTTLLFVSHDLGSVRDLCERTLYLRQGRVAFWGDTQQAIAQYHNEDQPTKANPAPGVELVSAPPSYLVGRQAFQAKALWWNDQPVAPQGTILGLALLNQSRKPISRLTLGQEIIFQVLFTSTTTASYHVAIEIKNRRDELVTSCGSYTCGLSAHDLIAGMVACFELSMTFNFEAGGYTVQAVLGDVGGRANRGNRIAETPWLGPIEANWDYEAERAPFLGMFGPPAKAGFPDVH